MKIDAGLDTGQEAGEQQGNAHARQRYVIELPVVAEFQAGGDSIIGSPSGGHLTPGLNSLLIFSITVVAV